MATVLGFNSLIFVIFHNVGTADIATTVYISLEAFILTLEK